MNQLLRLAQSRAFRFAVICVALFAFGATIAGSVYDGVNREDAWDISREQLLNLTDTDAISTSREALGFDKAASTVNGLLDDPDARSGFLETGLLMSATERKQFDARIALGDAVRGMIGQAKENSAYAGARLEHTGNGIFHFYLTSDFVGDALLSTMQSSLSSDLNVQYHRVQYSEEFLREKMSQAWSVVSDAETGAHGLHTVSVDVRNNRVVVDLDENIEASSGPMLASQIKSGLSGIPVHVQYSKVPEPSSCYYYSCADPMAGGIVIRKGSVDGIPCTLGFMVKDGSNTQAMTAGHCGYNEDNDWYHVAYGNNAFGTEVAEGAYEDDGIDAMIVEIPEDQGSNHVASCVYDSDICVDILGYVDADEIYEGMIVNFLGGISGSTSGTVTDPDAEWTYEECDCTQYGIRLNISGLKKGDSGGTYRVNNDAVAIHSGRSGNTAYAATVDAILSIYDVTLRTS